jgi:hypothetical protein
MKTREGGLRGSAAQQGRQGKKGVRPITWTQMAPADHATRHHRNHRGAGTSQANQTKEVVMAQNQDPPAPTMPPGPDPALKRLERFVGTWQIRGRTLDTEEDNVTGQTTFEWLSGGFFLQQRSQLNLRMSRPPWNFGGGLVLIRRRHPPCWV